MPSVMTLVIACARQVASTKLATILVRPALGSEKESTADSKSIPSALFSSNQRGGTGELPACEARVLRSKIMGDWVGAPRQADIACSCGSSNKH